MIIACRSGAHLRQAQLVDAVCLECLIRDRPSPHGDFDAARASTADQSQPMPACALVLRIGQRRGRRNAQAGNGPARPRDRVQPRVSSVPVQDQLSPGTPEDLAQLAAISQSLAPADGRSCRGMVKHHDAHLCCVTFGTKCLFEPRKLIGTQAAPRQKRRGRQR